MRRKKRVSDKVQIQEATETLIRVLKRHGFTLQLYESRSSNSVYLKLDYGVANSIRISDHEGKAHLHYRFNLLTTCDGFNIQRTKRGLLRAYYPMSGIEQLITDVLEHRKSKIEQYGEKTYELRKNMSYDLHKNSRGFWSKSIVV